MQSKKRRLFSLFLTLSMLMTVVQPAFAAGEAAPAPAAEESVTEQLTAPANAESAAEINGTAYPTLDAAFAAAPEGAVVKLLKDITRTAGDKTLVPAHSITLDLNGRTLLGAGGAVITVPADLHLTIADNSSGHSGRIIGAQLTGSAAAATPSMAVMVEEKGQLTVNSGALVGQLITGSTGYADGRAVQSEGTVTVNGGQLTGVKVEGNVSKSTGTIGAYALWSTAPAAVKGNARLCGLEVSGDAANGLFAAVLSTASVSVSGNARLYGSLFLNKGAVRSDNFKSYSISVPMGSGDVSVADSAQLYAVKDASSVRSSSCSAIHYSAGGSVTVTGGLLHTMGGTAVNMASGKGLTIREGASLVSKNGSCVALYGEKTALTISGGLFRSADPYRSADLEDYRTVQSAGVSGGIFSHDFAQDQNDPALLAEGLRTQRGDLTDGVWSPSGSGALYKVTDGAVTNCVITVNNSKYVAEVGEKLAAYLPEPIEKKGYTFVGWFEGDTQVDGDTVIRGDMTIKSRYAPITYTVTIDGVKHSAEYNSKLSAVLPEPPEKAGHTFSGWFSGETKVNGDTVVKGDMTIVSRFTANIYTVTVDGVEHSAEYGSKLSAVLPEPPEKAGHTFSGWFSGETKVNGDTVVESDMKITSEWVFNVFTDVKEDDWFYKGVRYSSYHGLLAGISGTQFGPGYQMDRAMVVQMLYSLAGKPDVELNYDFSDVDNSMWYAKAVAWAIKTGVASGYDNGCFGPADVITREQMAVMLYSFAKKPAVSGEMDFADADQISDWARTAMQWAAGNHIMNGVGGNRISPKTTATRAEAAVMIMNFHQLMLEK